MNLTSMKRGKYVIKDVRTPDADTNAFLCTLGFIAGAELELSSVGRSNYVVRVNGAKYCIDTTIASAIELVTGEKHENCVSR